MTSLMRPYDRWLTIEPHVRNGLSDYKIAALLNISRQRVYQLRLQFDGRDGVRPIDAPRSPHDWTAVQKAYDEGASWRMLAKQFGFAPRSIQLARRRGDLTTTRTVSEALVIGYKNGTIPRPTPSDEARKGLSLRQSLKNSGGKCKWFVVAGINVQGTWERDIALKFEEWKIRWEKPKPRKSAWTYYLDGKLKRYTPDFYLSDFCLWIEVKGHWWGDDMRKMVAVGKRYPRRKILIVRKKEFLLIKQSIAVPSFICGTGKAPGCS